MERNLSILNDSPAAADPTLPEDYRSTVLELDIWLLSLAAGPPGLLHAA
jgi:hypothetical protein